MCKTTIFGAPNTPEGYWNHDEDVRTNNLLYSDWREWYENWLADQNHSSNNKRQQANKKSE